MNGKRIITFMVLAIMFLSACGNQAATETSVPTLTALAETSVIPNTGATQTELPGTTEVAATSASTATSEATSTSEPRPTNIPDCTNSASFVTDVTIPDNTEMAGDSPFIKTWRILNTGTCIWASDYTLTPYAGESMSAPESVQLPLTYPGENADISISLKAPNTVATHTGYFVVKNPAGLIMQINSDSRLWVVIDVKSTVAATATPASATTGTPATPSGASGNGFATVSCAYVLDSTKVAQVISAVNAYRAQFGLPAYHVDPKLTLAAQAHANDMACNNLFVHTGSNGSTPTSRVVVSGYAASSVSENVYGSYPPLSGQGAVDWWKNDRTDLQHNRNLVSDTFIDIGVGYSFFNNYGYYVIVFGSP